MPLPGGPSDKIGNRYELRWIVRQLVNLVTGRLVWLRIEPPGEDAIEFRCRSQQGEVAYQVKRGVSGGGHWTLAALADVLQGFGALLAAEPELRCVFGSSHAAPELQELTERAQASRDVGEFTKRFLGAKWITKAWSDLQKRWAVGEVEAWSRLRRISVASIGERDLQENTETILQLLFNAQPETTRAVLTDFALDSVHRVIDAGDVVRCLARQSIARIVTADARGIAPSVSPPSPTGVRRDAELACIGSLIASGKTTVLLGGISGIGKTTIASQFAAEWGRPVCWLDGALLSSAAEAIAALGEFVADSFRDNCVTQAIQKAEDQVAAAGRLAGKVLAANKCLVVWDGVDKPSQVHLRLAIDAIAATISGGGAQLVTAQDTWESGGTTTASIHVGGFDKPTMRWMLTEAFSDARAADVDASFELTRGHPYLVQLLIDAAQAVDLGTALRSMKSETGADALISRVVGHLPEALRKLVASLSWLEVPFGLEMVERLGGTASTLKELAARHLAARSGGEAYRIHDLVAHLIKTATNNRDRLEFQERAALLLHSIENPSWVEVRAMLRHARAASMTDVAREAGTTLLRYATDAGLWGLAREAAENLASDATDYFPHFILGKCYRMTGEFEQALKHYEISEAHAPTPRDREVARYDRASVLCELGRRPEADPLYKEMLDSKEPTTRAAARVALALGMSGRGETAAALRMLEDALQIAMDASAPRAVSEVHHAMARVHISEKEWVRARQHLKKAHSVRFDIQGPEGGDVLGWFHLYGSALQVERALQNRDGARSAAHGMWRYALLSGSIPWESDAAFAMCLADPNATDEEVSAAIARLGAIAGNLALSASLRVTALGSLVLCNWAVRRYEAAIEAILELLAIANEQNVDVPVFAHVSTDKEHDETVVQLSGGMGLLLPPGEGPDFITGLVTRILERRPELIQHARAVMGRVRQDKKPGSRRTAKLSKNKGVRRRKRR